MTCAFASGALAESNHFAARGFTYALYYSWFVYCAILAVTILYCGVRLIRILESHLENFSMPIHRINNIKTGIFKVKGLTDEKLNSKSSIFTCGIDQMYGLCWLLRGYHLWSVHASVRYPSPKYFDHTRWWTDSITHLESDGSILYGRCRSCHGIQVQIWGGA